MSKLVKRHRQATAKKALSLPAPVFTLDFADFGALFSGRL